MATANGKNDDLKSQLASRAENGTQGGDTFQALLKRMQPQIEKALPKHISPDRMARVALTAYNSNSKLKECNPMSVLAAVLISSQLGLEVNTPLGQAYIIPYGKQAQFQIGYKGLLDLAYRSGEYQVIYAMEVYENDEFDFAYGLDPYLTHKPAREPKGEPVYYYAVYKTKNGGSNFRVWSREKIDKHAKKYSQAVQKGWTSPWKTDFDAMAKKTVLKDLLKYAPLSIEMAQQISTDNTVGTNIDTDGQVQTEYIDVEFNATYDDSPDDDPALNTNDGQA
jgi:recombination protein RecT